MLSSVLHPDARAVRRVLGGQTDQFEPLVRRYLPAVRAVALAHTRNAADADDVAQDVFVAAYQRLNQLQEPSKFRGWLMTIARNTTQSFLRSRNREQVAREQVNVGDAVPPVDVVSDELRGLLNDQLNALDSESRELILLHYFSGYNAREIGDMMNLTHAAVRKRLQRAREALGARVLDAIGEEKPRDASAAAVRSIMIAVATAGVAWSAEGEVGTAVGVKVWTAVAVGVAALLAVGAWFVLPSDVAPGGDGGNVAIEIEQAVRDSGTESSVRVDDTTEAPHPSAGSRAQTAVVAPAAVSADGVVPGAVGDAEGVWEMYFHDGSDSDKKEELWMIVEIAFDGGGLCLFSRSEDDYLGLLRGGWVNDSLVLTTYPDANWQPITTADPEPAHVEAYFQDLIDTSPNRRERAAENIARLCQGSKDVSHQLNQRRMDGSTAMRVGANLALSIRSQLDFRELYTIELRRILDENYLFGTMRIESELRDGEIRRQEIGVQLVRLQDAEVDALAMEAALQQDLDSLVDALSAYLSGHDGKLPESLDALAGPNGALSADWKELEPGQISLARGTAVEAAATLLAHSHQPYRPEMATAAGLLSWEDYLTDTWGSAWPQGITLATIRRPGEAGRRVVLGVTGSVSVETVDAPGNEGPNADETEAERDARLLSVCQNHLKQLGIVIKMFEGENPSSRIPPGWRATYPEYMTDTSVFTCPCLDHEGPQYQILFPAMSESELMAIAAQVYGMDMDTYRQQYSESNTPIVVEQAGSHRDDSGRNVLFLDGHVEFLTESEFAQRVEPFLAYSPSSVE